MISEAVLAAIAPIVDGDPTNRCHSAKVDLEVNIRLVIRRRAQ